MKTAKKQKVPSYLVVSRAIVNGGDGKILLLQRSKNHTYYPLKWELPGTRFNANEDIIQSIERGVNQEANLIIEISSHRYYCQSRFVTNGKYADLTYLEITAEAKYLAGEVKISPDHQNFGYGDKQTVLAFFKGCKKNFLFESFDPVGVMRRDMEQEAQKKVKYV
jgi:8-oxo-dGTP diphosphatase